MLHATGLALVGKVPLYTSMYVNTFVAVTERVYSSDTPGKIIHPVLSVFAPKKRRLNTFRNRLYILGLTLFLNVPFLEVNVNHVYQAFKKQKRHYLF